MWSPMTRRIAPSPPSFEVLGENCKALISQLFKATVSDPDEDLWPVLLLVTDERNYVCGLPPFSNDEEKAEIVDFVIPELITSSKARAAGWAAACWYAPWTDSGDGPIMPSEHPDRQEMVMLYFSNGQTDLQWSADIRRRSGKSPLLLPWQSEGYGDASDTKGLFPNSINAALRINLDVS
jgi:hypothetical protein